MQSSKPPQARSSLFVRESIESIEVYDSQCSSYRQVLNPTLGKNNKAWCAKSKIHIKQTKWNNLTA